MKEKLKILPLDKDFLMLLHNANKNDTVVSVSTIYFLRVPTSLNLIIKSVLLFLSSAVLPVGETILPIISSWICRGAAWRYHATDMGTLYRCSAVCDMNAHYRDDNRAGNAHRETLTPSWKKGLQFPLTGK